VGFYLGTTRELLKHKKIEIAAVLIDIEAELRRLAMWDAEPPSEEALASPHPFAIDTLTLPQWLQFVFLPRMYRIIEADGVLPTRCGIAPMAEEFFRGARQPIAGLLDALERVDVLLSDTQPNYSIGASRG
jgi:uncharacterized protein YqcC (DUF446 family)